MCCRDAPTFCFSPECACRRGHLWAAAPTRCSAETPGECCCLCRTARGQSNKTQHSISHEPRHFRHVLFLPLSRRFLSFFFSTFAAFIYSHRRLSAPENLNITKFFLVFLLLLYFQLVHGDDDNLNARVTRPCDCTVGLAVASSAMRERKRNIYVSLCSSSPISFFSMKFCYLPRCVFSLTPAAPIPGNLQILF